MKHIAVIGLGFGDEGKGRVVDWLCSQHPMRGDAVVIRFSGGPQAAHRVVLPNGIEHVFSHYGSGTLRGVPTVFTKDCLVNPIAMLNEFDILKQKCETQPSLFVSPKCPVITPYDIDWNRQSKLRMNGTCGSGIFATIRREKSGCHFLFEDLYHGKNIIKMKLEQVAKFYDKEKKSLNIDKMFIDACEEMIDREAAFRNYGTKRQLHIYEGSQGLLLDQEYGFFPHVTPSNTGTKNISQFNPEIILVTRSYQTRHGNGPMSPIIPHKIKENPNEKNTTNEFQGKFRKTILDLDLIKYAISKDEYIKHNSNKLFITCLDHVEEERRMFHHGKVFECADENHFWMKIHNEIGTKSVHTSYGPTSLDVNQRI
jgi:adenylosuccinate synthase